MQQSRELLDWPAFFTNLDSTSLSTTLTLSSPSKWANETDYDLFLRILFVHIYKTGLSYILPSSPLLRPLPPNLKTGQSPSSLRAVPRLLVPGDHLLPLWQTLSSSSDMNSDFSFSYYPALPPSSLCIPMGVLRKFHSAVYQSSWALKQFPEVRPADFFCLDMMLNVFSITEDKRDFLAEMKKKISGELLHVQLFHHLTLPPFIPIRAV